MEIFFATLQPALPSPALTGYRLFLRLGDALSLDMETILARATDPSTKRGWPDLMFGRLTIKLMNNQSNSQAA
jgi:hypothetical protein